MTFKISICCEFVLCGSVISLSIYKLSMNPGTDLVLLTTIQYLAYTLMQLFMYCFFGNRLTQKAWRFRKQSNPTNNLFFFLCITFILQSLSLSREIYKINWLGLSKSNSQMLLIMMLRAQRPVIISGGHLFHLKLETFLKVSTYMADKNVENFSWILRRLKWSLLKSEILDFWTFFYIHFLKTQNEPKIKMKICWPNFPLSRKYLKKKNQNRWLQLLCF